MSDLRKASAEWEERPKAKEKREEMAEEREREVRAIFGAWKNHPKGPKLTEKEMNDLRQNISSGKLPNRDEVRRMMQTLDCHHLGFEHGTLKEFPPISGTVYTRHYYEGFEVDIFEGRVISHNTNGSISVKTPIGDRHIVEEWHEWYETREEASRLF
jgi:hypothetical protein